MRLKYYIMSLGLFVFVSCETEIATPDFRVTTDATTYQVGEEIRFLIQGNADMISFYSGEPTNEYAFKSGRVIDISEEGATLVFSSGVMGGEQEDQLSLLASTDFDGGYDDLEGVKSANWIDITERFQWGTTETFLNSSVQDVSDLLVPGQPIYFAFRYITRPQETNGLARTHMIQTFQLNSLKSFNDAPLTIADQPNAGFQIVDQEPENAPSRSSITTSRVSLLGNIYKDPSDPIYDPNNPIFDPENPIYDPESHLYEPTAVRPPFVPYDPNSPYNDPATETWAISKPITIGEVDLGPDWSEAIKGIANTKLEEFRYSYDKPGNYKVYFVAINATINGSKEIVEELDITIVP